MILTQKPIAPHFALSPAHHHRRHPSAPPAVVVQPTRTPGLLSLSKPVVHAQRPAKVLPKKQLPAALPAAATTTAAVSVVTSSASRGRSQDKPKSKPKDKQPATARSSSRRGHRQPSPPLNTSSQAEDPPLPPAPIPIPKVRNAPTLTEKPSGKLAKRRQQHQPHAPQQFLSKSVPVTSHLPRTLSDTTFPICDDMTEAGDLSRPVTPENQPVTPTRPRSKRAPASHINLPAASAFFDDGPKTAPLSSTSGPSLFPFPATTSPFSSPRKSNNLRSNRRHKRSPSEGVFLMSSSEESDSSASKSLIKRHSATSFTPPRKRVSTIQGGGSRPLNLPMTEEEKEAYFASSSFQNSPSPEDLPPPDF